MSNVSPGRQNHEDVAARGALLPLRVEFKDPDGELTAVTGGRARLLADGEPVFPFSLNGDPDTAGWYALLTTATTGIYAFDIMTDDLEARFYDVEFVGDISVGASTVSLMVKGTISIGAVSRERGMMLRIRTGLMDDRIEEYQLDAPLFQWSDTQLYYALIDCLSAINSAGPRASEYTMGNFPFANEELLTTGGRIYALEARARFERSNEMSYTDGHTLNIDRASFYWQMAQGLRADWMNRIVSWKKSTPPFPIGLRAQSLPFRITRVLSLMPGYENFFAGQTFGGLN